MDVDLTLAEAAAVLRIPRQSLQRLAKAGGIGHYRIGRHYRFTRDDLAEYKAANHVAPAIYMGRSRSGRRRAS